MKFSNYIKQLEKRAIIARKPDPVIPFILAFITLVLGVIMFYTDVDKIWCYAFFFLLARSLHYSHRGSYSFFTTTFFGVSARDSKQGN